MKTVRNCANCACSEVMNVADGKLFEGPKPTSSADMQSAIAGGQQLGMCCRRNQPEARHVRVQVPVLVKDEATGQMKPSIDRAGRPRTTEAMETQFGFRPVPPEGVCFDGWRPEGTPPGHMFHVEQPDDTAANS